PHTLIAWRHCGDRSSEVGCGRSLDEVLAPGTYFVAVDGAIADSFGRFTVAWTLQDLTAQNGACQAAPMLVERQPTASTTIGAGDKFSTACAGGDTGTTGPDRVFRFVLPARAEVRVAVMAPTFDAAVAIRKACTDGSGGGVAELACEADTDT